MILSSGATLKVSISVWVCLLIWDIIDRRVDNIKKYVVKTVCLIYSYGINFT